jgi:hypothetical protein
MILGIGAAAFTVVHVVLSLVAIGSGFVVVFGLFTARRLPAWTAIFLATTALANLTGFLFPFHGMTLSIEMGIPSLAVLMLAVIARYSRKLAGTWRHTYVVSVMIALYCEVAVLVAKVFAKVLAPTAQNPGLSEPLLNLTQLAVFVAFAAGVHFALKRFRSGPGHRI